MDVPVFVVDAFTDRAFSGNPAAVCVLDAPLGEGPMQAVAAEMNLSETAFVHPLGGGRFGLRWFTPAKEVPLCGHATLASAAVLRERGERAATLRFDSRSGELRVADAPGGALTMDFPLDPPAPFDPPKALLAAVGADAVDARVGARSGNVLLRLRDEDAVRRAAPDPRALVAAMPHADGVILTAPGREAGVDFVSRYFTPWYGIDEDPVTGSTHTLLAPYWRDALGKPAPLEARQVSRRGGALRVTVRGDRVDLTGRAVVVLRGTLTVPDA